MNVCGDGGLCSLVCVIDDAVSVFDVWEQQSKEENSFYKK